MRNEKRKLQLDRQNVKWAGNLPEILLQNENANECFMRHVWMRCVSGKKTDVSQVNESRSSLFSVELDLLGVYLDKAYPSDFMHILCGVSRRFFWPFLVIFIGASSFELMLRQHFLHGNKSALDANRHSQGGNSSVSFKLLFSPFPLILPLSP